MGAFVLRFLSVMCFPHPSKAVHGWERAGVGLPSLLGVTWADPPLEWNSINMSGPMVDFPRTKTHLSSSSPHDGGQMSAAVCRLLRMSMWHVNMSSRIKCCRRIFHLLQCLHGFSMCVYIRGEDLQWIRSVWWRERTQKHIYCSFYQMLERQWQRKRLRNDGIHLDIVHCFPDNLNLIAKAK